MKNDKNIIDELKKISSLIMQMKKNEAYSVPPLYFDNLSSEIIDRITSLNKERAYYFGSFASYSIPHSYFKNLPDIILKRVGIDQKQHTGVLEEMEEISPLLNTISKKPVYDIPPNFFDNIVWSSLQSQPQKAKIVSISKWPKVLKYTAAAVIIPFLAISVFNLSGKDFVIFRSNHNKAKNQVKNLSKEEIVNFLKNSPSSENAFSTSQNTSINEDEIKSSLKQISDKEIHHFLKETGELDEI